MNHHGRAFFAALAPVLAVGLALAGCATAPNTAAVPAIETITTSGDAARARVVIRGTKPLQYTAFRLSDPPRVVVDMPGLALGNNAGPHPSQSSLLLGVTASELTRGANRIARIEIGVDAATNFTVTPEPATRSLVIELDGSAVRLAESAGARAPEAPEGSAPAAPTLDAKLARAEPPAPPAPDADGAKVQAGGAEAWSAPSPSDLTAPSATAGGPAPAAGPSPAARAGHGAGAVPGRVAIRKVTAAASGDSTEILIEATGPITRYEIFRLASPPRVVLDIQAAKSQVRRPRVAVRDPRVSAVRLGTYQSKVRVVLDLAGKGDSAYQVTPDPRGLVVTVGPKGGAPVKEGAATGEAPASATAEASPDEVTAKAEGVPTREAAADESTVPAAPVESAPAEPTKRADAPTPPERPAALRSDLGRPGDGGLPIAFRPPARRVVGLASQRTFAIPESGKRYTGRRLSLDFKDADIENILRLIAEISNLNIVTGDDVKGKISLRLINVPWDQALDIVLESQGLGMVRTGNVVRIAPTAKLKAEDDAAIAAKAARQKLEDLSLEIIPVNYALASDIQNQIKGLLTDRGKVTLDGRTNALVVSDVKSAIDQARALVSALDTVTPQVLIEARIVEASLDFTREIGVQWGGTFTASAASGNPTGVNFPSSIGVTGGAGTGFAVNLPAAIGPGSGGGLNFALGSLTNFLNLDIRLSALEETGEGRVISSPKVTTLDNKEASIEQGLSIPFETTSTSGTQTTFVDANLNLTVTPHVTNDESISLKIKATKNAPDTSIRGASGAPSISKKEAKTEVLVKNGQTTVIGGIYQINRSDTVAGVPWFHRLPLIGWLFKKSTTVDQKSELLIFITPRIVRSVQQAASR